MEIENDNTKPLGHLNNPSGEVIKIARELWDQVKNDKTAAEMLVAELRRELEVERAKTPDERLADAAGLIEALKEIADHHCANLSPEFIRDIPAGAFETAAMLVDKVIGATQRDGERAAVWRGRAYIVNDWRDRRGTPEWAARVAEYKVKQLREQAERAGYAIVPLEDLAKKSKTKAKKPKTKAKAKPTKRKAKKRR